MKQKKTQLEKILSGKTKKIARSFFEVYTIPNLVTKKEYKNLFDKRTMKHKKSFVMPLVNKCLNEWKRAGFIDISNMKVPFTIVKRKKGKPYNHYSYGYLLNLNPIYEFCKEKNIEFSEEEKLFLKHTLLDENLRRLILTEYPEEDIIHATLKYYAKNYILFYNFLLRDIRENKEKYAEEYKEAEELNNPKDEIRRKMKKTSENISKKLAKKFNQPYKPLEFDVLKSFIYSEKFIPVKKITNNNIKLKKILFKLYTNPTGVLKKYYFRSYIRHIENKPEIVKSLDMKILNVLGLNPNI